MFWQFRRAAVAALLLSAGMAAQAVAASLNYSGGLITNNMDWLPTNVTNGAQTVTGQGPHDFSVITNAATPGRDGWQLANPGGSSTDTEFKSQDGSLSGSAGRGVVSFGANGSTERALGALPTSNQISTFGLALLNTSSDVFENVTISFWGEQWRRGDVTSPETLTFAYGEAANIGGELTNHAGLSFSSPNTQAAPTNVALDGNAAGNRVFKSATINGLSWAPGETLVLRWSISEQSGQDDALAIDDFGFQAQIVPEPSAIVTAGLSLVGLAVVGLRRRRRSRIV